MSYRIHISIDYYKLSADKQAFNLENEKIIQNMETNAIENHPFSHQECGRKIAACYQMIMGNIFYFFISQVWQLVY